MFKLVDDRCGGENEEVRVDVYVCGAGRWGVTEMGVKTSWRNGISIQITFLIE